jgi:hypothetical protein
MENKKYSYWNDISKSIPENIELLTEKDKQEFLTQWSRLVYTENVQSSDAILRNIRDMPPIVLGAVPAWLMDRVKETADHYVRGQWLSSISVSGVVAEFLTFHILENHVRQKGITDLVKFSRKLGSQDGRLNTLKELGIITKEEHGQLSRIREIRNQYVHLNVAGARIKDDCLDAVRNLINFLNKHELFFFRFHFGDSEVEGEDEE